MPAEQSALTIMVGFFCAVLMLGSPSVISRAIWTGFSRAARPWSDSLMVSLRSSVAADTYGKKPHRQWKRNGRCEGRQQRWKDTNHHWRISAQIFVVQVVSSRVVKG